MDNELKHSIRAKLFRGRAIVIAMTIGLCAAVVLLYGAGCSGSANSPRAIGEPRAIMVKDVNGNEHRPLMEGGEKGTLFFFMLHDCPVANAYVPEMNRIAATYGPKGVRSYLVYVENDLSDADARKHAQEHKIGFPALLDRRLQLVKLTGATISPEAALISPEHRVIYHGRIDDRAVSLGKRRLEPTTRDLREALDATLEGKPVPTPVTKAVGCYLPGHD